MKALLVLAFIAASWSVNSAADEDAHVGRLRRFLSSGFSLSNLSVDDRRSKLQMVRQLLNLRTEEGKMEGVGAETQVDPEIGLNAEGIVKRSMSNAAITRVQKSPSWPFIALGYHP